MLTADLLHRHACFCLLQNRHNLGVTEFRSLHGLPPDCILPRFSTYDWSTFWGSLRSFVPMVREILKLVRLTVVHLYKLVVVSRDLVTQILILIRRCLVNGILCSISQKSRKVRRH